MRSLERTFKKCSGATATSTEALSVIKSSYESAGDAIANQLPPHFSGVGPSAFKRAKYSDRAFSATETLRRRRRDDCGDSYEGI